MNIQIVILPNLTNIPRIVCKEIAIITTDSNTCIYMVELGIISLFLNN